MDRLARQASALRACLEALRLVAREVRGADKDPERGRWVAVGLAAALQGALIAALSGYETAKPEDVMGTGITDHYAPVALLLRRARSSAHLASPERLQVTSADQKALQEVIERRNAALHGSPLEAPQAACDLIPVCLKVLRHLIVEHPAFNSAEHPLVMACLKDELERLSDVFPEAS